MVGTGNEDIESKRPGGHAGLDGKNLLVAVILALEFYNRTSCRGELYSAAAAVRPNRQRHRHRPMAVQISQPEHGKWAKVAAIDPRLAPARSAQQLLVNLPATDWLLPYHAIDGRT